MNMNYLRMANEHILALLMRLLWAAALVLPGFGAQGRVIYTNFHSFDKTDGAFPSAGLVEGSDGNFYDTTTSGGTYTNGTVFRIGTNGVLTTLYSFIGGPDGAAPYGGLVQGRDGSFYGTTYQGGTNNLGTVFRLTVVPGHLN
ncbi:MAG: choice-of-anchor tandem repeat GloVer-containing protein [Limisphaerales bacterium]